MYQLCFFFQAEDGIRDWSVTGVQTCALPISMPLVNRPPCVMLLPVGSSAPTALMSPLIDHLVKSAGSVVNCCVLPPCAIDNVAGTSVIAMFELSLFLRNSYRAAAQQYSM